VNKSFLALVFLSLLPSLSSAQAPAGGSESSLPIWNEMRGEKLIALQARGDALRGEISFEPCQGCHRRDASGRTSGSYPRLAGQHGTVLIKQMTDIRAGRRSNPKMEPFIGDHVLSPMEIANIAAYVSNMPIPTEIGQGPGTTRARGQELYAKDCAVCHGDQGEGKAVKFFPMVAAQHYRYLLREVQFIRSTDRRNANPDMVKVIAKYSDADLEAVADFMAQLPAPKR
jgi:cytochrome c553